MENRTLLLECAKELFYLKGYDAVGVQEIVDRVGITKPTLYYYFGSKLGLLKTLLEIKFAELKETVNEALSTNGDIREVLYRLASSLGSYFDKDREFYMLMMSLYYSARENEAYQVVKPFLNDFFESIVGAFAAKAHELGNMQGRQRQFAIGFIGTVNQYLLFQCEIDPKHEEAITDQKMMALVNQFMYGIFS